jgi:hypothetical protein
MTNRAKKISELVATVSPSSDDLLVIVDSPSANAVTKKVTVGNLMGNSTANVTISNSAILSANTLVIRRKHTPTSSSTSDQQGTIYFDDNYLYVAISNGAVKRVSLNAF